MEAAQRLASEDLHRAAPATVEAHAHVEAQLARERQRVALLEHRTAALER
eukprot:COSAG01_NODE_34677_length_543_cov_4.195946_1_plen_49_part_10